MSDLRDDMRQLREAWQDLWFAIFDALGLPRLAKRLGRGDPRQWYREADTRSKWRKKP